MPLDFRNINTLWASVIAETCYRLGLTTAIACPGSRSAPLTVAFAQHPHLETISILDERSAAFFALGVAKQTGQSVVLICTSGTAGANFYPAVIEAALSHVPLIILTADRPPELRHCHAGQTINQIRLYGDYPNWQTELALPQWDLLDYLRQTMVHAWRRSHFPQCGVVHLNLPFREPLAPLSDPDLLPLGEQWDEAAFFEDIRPPAAPPLSPVAYPSSWVKATKGLIIGGLAQPREPKVYCQAIAHLAQTLQFPVLAEGLSPLRNYAPLNPHLITTYDTLLRHPHWADQLVPDLVIQIGELPTSKVLRTWLTQHQPPRWILDPHPENFDPLHHPTHPLPCTVEQLQHPDFPPSPSPYLHQWQTLNQQVNTQLNATLDPLETLFEGKLAWLLSQTLPPHTPIFISNSTPVRDVEYFWQPNPQEYQPFFNRGANGIDGIVSTALGIAHGNRPTVLVTGDLALLHDTNGLLQQGKLRGHLTIIAIANNGGGIFELLPIAQYDPPFTDYFATPQNINLQQLASTYGIPCHPLTHWQQLPPLLNPLPPSGVRLLLLPTQRQSDAHYRKILFSQVLSS
ncbi:2-succinyl-5-enolpyruvyl-6-hydroxy-3-cyclohexene-1-carboxylic-acid synthase [Spirulina subsalsa FACHB-351]|uniref:2-succinyl-5-enolpyruvyl-6-hydroxy-3-cyclohexene-1-carboxylate synthase n=1 Tax=Spirulina subsalsa FACHB-351 TaxID=234711 RepID=A0ABT3L5U6_9CYAN|nr:2-succinyl-5-enolpyruvyl-6-hydroxy-3-cyclohexene-1-carboxylic-acid synthase [Spirulina subsalsa]MCW6036886.1 2-succinyl-5-enolpyruvyl-6-hydroxy-3-cyclohexene-1-carboxylic-acid synthase [Spirulina subsalsa FACHB-351]